MNRVINFFKIMGFYNEDYFDYLNINTKIIDKNYNDLKDFIGCFKVENDCKLILPKIHNIYDELIYVHEYSHALFLDDDLELFPNVMEALYIDMYVSDIELKKEIINNICKEKNNNNDKKHLIGKKTKLLLLNKEI